MGLRDVWNNVKETISEGLIERLSGTDSAVLAKAKPQEQEKQPATVIPPEASPEEMSALLADPFALIETLGYRERYSSVSYDVLNRMSYYVPIYPTILATRRNQVSAFCAPQTDTNLPGFRIGLRDKKRTISKKELIRAQGLEEWMVNTGSSSQLTRDPLDTAIRKLMRDSLVYDQCTWEKVRNKKGVICDWYVVDGASIRIADTAWKDGPKSDDDVAYVQVHDETVIAEFTPNELAFCVRNPRSDLRVNGYGEAELEQGIKIATALINGWHYNSKFFENGTVAKGMLNIPGIPQNKLRIFANQWRMITSGVLNGWRHPITNFQDAKWIDFQKSNRDMEWAEFINFCIKLFCGLSLIDPAELHMQFGNIGQAQSMFQAPAEEKIKYSKDKGLRPLLAFVASQFNRHLIWQLDPDLCFYFTGLDPRESEKAVDIEQKQGKYRKTVNELRIENDEKPLSAEEGDIILDPTWMQNHLAIKQAAQEKEMQEQQGADGGEEGADGGYEDTGDEGDWAAKMIGAEDEAAKSLVDDEPIGGSIRYELEF